MIGRDLAVREICDKLSNRRFVSLVGPGGIGKTTVAVGVAHELLSRVAQDVRFMDLASIRDQLLVPNHIAAAVGVTIHTSNATETLVTFLRDKQMLLVLDSCEHVIDVTARVAERISAEAPHVSILVTSREPLRVEGEHIYRLLPLATPPESGEIDAQVALTFPAVQLFIERAAASGVQLDLTDAEAPAVAQLCRTLDGIPLAIELAAGRVHAFGVRELAMMLDSRLLQLTGARRTAVRRHQTLSAMLDWSHDLLQEQERVLSRRLSIFVAPLV
jgi:predicted ATPase